LIFIPKRKINVKKHPRRLPTGETTFVRKHEREIERIKISESDKQKIKNGKSMMLQAFESSIETEFKSPMSRQDSGYTVHYRFTVANIQNAKVSVKEYRSNGFPAYYYRGSVNKKTVYRVYSGDEQNLRYYKGPKEDEFVKLSKGEWADIKPKQKKEIVMKTQLKKELDYELGMLNRKMKELESEEKDVVKARDKAIEKYGYNVYNAHYKKHYTKRFNSIYGKQDRLRDKINNLEALGINSSRKYNVLKEFKSSKFKIIETKKDIVSTEYTKIGYIEDLGYVRVEGMRWSGMGMKSLAGKYDIDKIELISEKEYNKLISGDVTKTVSFAGAKETKVIRPKKAAKLKVKSKSIKEQENYEIVQEYLEKELDKTSLKKDRKLFIFSNTTGRYEPADKYSYATVLSKDLYVQNPLNDKFKKLDYYKKGKTKPKPKSKPKKKSTGPRCPECGSENYEYFDKSGTEHGFKRCWTCFDCSYEDTEWLK